MIGICPITSGGRIQDSKKIDWNIIYTKDNKLNAVEIIIPRSEIITFGKFDQDTFDRLNPQD